MRVNASPADGPPIEPGLDVDLERQVHLGGIGELDADERPRRVVGIGDQLDVAGLFDAGIAGLAGGRGLPDEP